ncbi:NAD(P)-binding protein [Xylariaceae sp. FL0804]|nr:NAD(P)-binding protein [Xylariaceae sp. FL0804]
MAATAAVIGSTGLVGGHILSTLLGLEAYKTVHTVSRRHPKAEQSPKLDATVEPDTTKWAPKLSSIAPPPTTVFSALGTTRAQAGGIQNQWKIDHDLNVELAKAAHGAGVKMFVFVSSGGTRGLGGFAPYSKMKNGVEDTVRDLGFEQAIILRPGFIYGEREVPHAGGPLLSKAFNSLGYISAGLKDKFSQDADVIARAAVKAAMLASEGKAPSKYWVVETPDIVRLGRDEWKS